MAKNKNIHIVGNILVIVGILAVLYVILGTGGWGLLLVPKTFEFGIPFFGGILMVVVGLYIRRKS